MQSRKRLWNILMGCGVCLLLLLGVLAAGWIRGWFSGPDAQAAGLCVEEIVGQATVTRSGAAFRLEEGFWLKEGDQAETERDARVVLAQEANRLILSEKTIIQLTDQTVSLRQGELWAEGQAGLTVLAPDTEINSQKAVFYVSAPAGSVSIYVFAGEIQAGGQTVEAGSCLLLTGQTKELAEFSPEDLNEFALRLALENTEEKSLCFSADELRGVLQEREAAAYARLESALSGRETEPESADASEKENGSGAGQPPAAQSSAGADTAGDPAASAGQPQPSAAAQANAPQQTETNQTAAAPEQSAAAASEPGTAVAPEPSMAAASEPGTTAPGTMAALTCTIEIRCDTILQNMDSLAAEKQGFVPADGVILRALPVAFADGETVYDVLRRAVDAAGIPLEASYTPLYGSYYIEGINNLYEFDCGSESGWMYQVNGWFPNYGCSAYTLHDGDTILFQYTCHGLGADLK